MAGGAGGGVVVSHCWAWQSAAWGDPGHNGGMVRWVAARWHCSYPGGRVKGERERREGGGGGSGEEREE